MPNRVSAIIVVLLLSAFGPPRKIVVLVAHDKGARRKGGGAGNGATVQLAQPLQAVETKAGQAPGTPFVATQEDVGGAFAGALAAMPRAPVSYVIYFLNARAEP